MYCQISIKRCRTAVALKSALGRALHYLREKWTYLIRFLKDWRQKLNNNRAERSLKPIVMGRKNLFANTEGGAQSSAIVYSMIETAKENPLSPYQYLTWLLRDAPKLAAEEKNLAEKLLPENAPQSSWDIPVKI